jgi:hypothetical protein
MLFRMILYVMVGFFIYRVVQLVGRMMSTGRREKEEDPPARPEPHIPDFKDVKDADFIDITPKDKGPDNPGGS